MPGSSSSIKIGFNIDANTAQAIAAIKALQASLTGLKASLTQIGGLKGGIFASNITEATAAAKSTKVLAQEQANLAAQARQVSQSHMLLGQVFAGNRQVTDKYLSSIGGLKQAFAQVNTEADSFMVKTKGGVAPLSSLGGMMGTTGIKANMLAQTLDNMAKKQIDLGRALQQQGKNLTLGLTLPITALIAELANLGFQMDKANIQLKNAFSGIGLNIKDAGDLTGVLNRQAEQLSGQFGNISKIDLTNTQAQLTSVGKSISDIKSLTALSAQVNAVGDFNNIAEATKLVKTLYTNLGQSVNEATSYVQIFNAVARNSNVSLKDLSSSILPLVNTFKQFNIKPAEGAALLSQFAAATGDAGTGVTALQRTFSSYYSLLGSFNTELGSGQKAIKAYVNEWNKDPLHAPIALDTKNGVNSLMNLAKAYKQMGTERDKLLQDVVGKFMAGKDVTLFNQLTGNPEQFQKALSQAENAAKIWNDQVQTFLSDPSTKFKAAIQQIKNAGTNLGAELLPKIAQLVQHLADLVNWFTKLPAPIKEVTAALVGLTAVLGPLEVLSGSMRTMTAQLFRTFLTKPLLQIAPALSGRAISSLGGTAALGGLGALGGHLGLPGANIEELLANNPQIASLLGGPGSKGVFAAGAPQAKIDELLSNMGVVNNGTTFRDRASGRIVSPSDVGGYSRLSRAIGNQAVQQSPELSALADTFSNLNGSGRELDKLMKASPEEYKAMTSTLAKMGITVEQTGGHFRLLDSSLKEISSAGVFSLPNIQKFAKAAPLNDFGKLGGSIGPALPQGIGASGGILGKLKGFLPGAVPAVEGAATAGGPEIIAVAAPAIAAAAAIAAAVALIAVNWSKVQKGISDGVGNIKSAFKDLINAVVGPFAGLLKDIGVIGGDGSKAGKDMSDTWKQVGQILNTAMDTFSVAIRFIASVAKPIFEAIAQELKVVINIIQAIVAALTGNWGQALDHIKTAAGAFAKVVLDIFGMMAKGALTVLLLPINEFLLGLEGIAKAGKFFHIPGAAEAAKLIGGIRKDLNSIPSDLQNITNSANGNIGNTGIGLGGSGAMSSGARKSKAEQFAKDQGLSPEDAKQYADIYMTAFNDAMKHGASSGEAAKTAQGQAQHFVNLVKGVFDSANIGKLPPPDTQAFQDTLNNALDEAKTTIQALHKQATDAAKDLSDAAIAAYDESRTKLKQALENQYHDREENVTNQITAIDRLEKSLSEAAAADAIRLREQKYAQDLVDARQSYIAESKDLLASGETGKAAIAGLNYGVKVRTFSADEAKAQQDDAKQKQLDSLTDQKQLLQDQKQAITDQKTLAMQSFDDQTTANKKMLTQEIQDLTQFAPRNEAEYKSMVDKVQQVLRNNGVVLEGAATNVHDVWLKAIKGVHDALADTANWSLTDNTSNKLIKEAADLGNQTAAAFLNELTAANLTVDDSGKYTAGPTPDQPNFFTHASQIANDANSSTAQHGLKRHSGGAVPGVGEVPATLLSGEYVVKRNAVNSLGLPMLDALNSYGDSKPMSMGGGNNVVSGLSLLTQKFVHQFVQGKIKNFAGLSLPQAKSLAQGQAQGAQGALGLGNFSIKDLIANHLLASTSGLQPGALQLLEYVMHSFPGIFFTSGFRPGGSSYHASGQAIDIDYGGDHGKDLAVAQFLVPLAAQGVLAELIHTPLGYGYKDGKKVDTASFFGQAVAGEHYNHVHAAVANAFAGSLILSQALKGQVAAGYGGVINSPGDFASTLLGMMHLPISKSNVAALVGWAKAEGGHWNDPDQFNPFNTTQPEPGSHGTNSVGVQSYTSWGQGLQATIQTLTNGLYGGVLQALALGNNPYGVARAVAASPWGTPDFSGLIQLASGGSILNDGAAYLHKGETVLTKPLSERLHQSINNNSGGDLVLQISGFMGGNQEIEKLAEVLERRIVPKLNRSKGYDNRMVSGF